MDREKPGTMPERGELERQFLANLELIERIALALCRRRGMSSEVAGDFLSWLKLKIVQSDYALFAKFRGESSITTYLAVGVAMLARDYCAERWGRWRPSAAARRRGLLAMRLETLVHRDGHSLKAAGEILRTSGETTLSDRGLASLLDQLPARAPLRPLEVGSDVLDELSAPASADDRVRLTEHSARQLETEAALTRALARLPVEDALIVRMRYCEGASVADIARALRVEQKPLYRRLDRALGVLRRQLEADGITRTEARTLVAEAAP